MISETRRHEEKGGGEMKKEMKNILVNLLTVKSIVTLVLTVIFSILSVYDRISGEQFLNIFSVVIAFYFGTQYQKGEQKKGGDEE